MQNKASNTTNIQRTMIYIYIYTVHKDLKTNKNEPKINSVQLNLSSLSGLMRHSIA
jgi:hypothetical protein